MSGAWALQSEKRYVYDGTSVVQERDGSNNILVKYTWDGNIGGLLSRSTATDNFYYHYDGHGNVVQLTDANQGTVAQYSYDAFGNLLSSSGAEASNNPYRFSTKEIHLASGLYDYGYRFYSPGLGRWINRDPIEENGGLNLYRFVSNNPVNSVDPDGLEPCNEIDIRFAGYMCWKNGKKLQRCIAAFTIGGMRTVVYKCKDKPPAKKKACPPKKKNPRSQRRPGRRYTFKTRKQAYEAAKRAGKGCEPEHHPNDPRGPHFHPRNPNWSRNDPRLHDHYYYGGRPR